MSIPPARMRGKHVGGHLWKGFYELGRPGSKAFDWHAFSQQELAKVPLRTRKLGNELAEQLWPCDRQLCTIEGEAQIMVESKAELKLYIVKE